MGGIFETASTLKTIVPVVMESKDQDQIEYTGHQRKRSSRAISLIRRTNQEYQVCEKHQQIKKLRDSPIKGLITSPMPS